MSSSQQSAVSVQPKINTVCIVLFAFSCLAFSAASKASGPETVEQELRAKYQGQVVMLRNFYCGKELRFDAQANLLSGGWSGPWTLCRDVRINDVTIKNGEVKLTGQRIYLYYDSQQNRFRDAAELPNERNAYKAGRKTEKVSLKMTLPPGVEDSAIPATIGKLFYASEEEFWNSMAPLWTNCIVRKVGSDEKPESKMHPFGDLSQVLSQADPSAQPAHTSQAGGEASTAVLRVGHGVSAPVPVYSPDPGYSDVARKALLQGIVVVKVIVGPDGRLHNPTLVRCAGMGLDENTLKTLADWRFRPATKDGKPVAVEVSVEVSFNTY